jgi:hypothetical protein
MHRIFLLAGFVLIQMNAVAQVVLTAGDFPSTVGMTFVTEDDTTAAVTVNVGLPGANQTWVLDQPYPGIQSTQNIVAGNTTPYAATFPTANLVTQYQGKLGSQINSFFFDDISGSFSTYQEKKDDRILLHGIGVTSSTYAGPIQFAPAIHYFSLPLEFGKAWETASTFSISMDTSFFGIPATIVAQIQDSLVARVDGWGTLKLPEATHNCVRVKSYITLDEKLYLSGDILKENKSRTINYFWVAEKYGVVAKVISHLNETNDNFTSAAQVSRLVSFSSTSAVSGAENAIRDFRLGQNFPNPFNATTVIPFTMNRPGQVRIEIFNLHGQHVTSLANSFFAAGTYQIPWNGLTARNECAPSGLYLIKMSLRGTPHLNETQKILLVR